MQLLSHFLVATYWVSASLALRSYTLFVDA